jgi:hypothetical protein
VGLDAGQEKEFGREVLGEEGGEQEEEPIGDA